MWIRIRIRIRNTGGKNKAQTAPLVPRSLVELSFNVVEHVLGSGGIRAFVKESGARNDQFD
jgi:hypothetical protein